MVSPTGRAEGARLVRWATGTALVIWVVICSAVALAATYVAGVLVSAYRDGIAEDFVVLAALVGGPAPWIVAVMLWKRGRNRDLPSRLTVTASGLALGGFFALAMLIAVAVLGDTTGTAQL